MRLGQAANYFNRTTFDGWNGTAWTDNVVAGTLLGYDRSINLGRLFDTKRRTLLINPAVPLSEGYTVIRPHREPLLMFLVGIKRKDVESAVYSDVLSLHQVSADVGLYLNATTTRASGVPSVMTSTLQKTVYGDFEKITETGKEQFQGVAHSSYAVVLPAGTAVNRNYDLKIGGTVFVVAECFPYEGLIRCNVREKDVP